MLPVHNSLENKQFQEILFQEGLFQEILFSNLQELLNDLFGPNLSPYHASWKTACEERFAKIVVRLQTMPPQTRSEVASRILRSASDIIRDKTESILKLHFTNKNMGIPSAIKSAVQRYPFKQLPFDPNRTLDDFAKLVAEELLTPNPLQVKVTQMLGERFSEGGVPPELIKTLESYPFDRVAIDTNETFDNTAYRIASYIAQEAPL